MSVREPGHRQLQVEGGVAGGSFTVEPRPTSPGEPCGQEAVDEDN